MLPPSYKAHRGTGWGSSPLQESHPGLTFLKMWRNILMFFLLYFPVFNCWHHWTMYDWLLTFHSFKQWLLKKIPASCMQGPHSSHIHYWGVCVSLIFIFTDNDGSLAEWIMLSQQSDHIKSAKIIICAFSTKSCIPKSINIDAFIYNKSITS